MSTVLLFMSALFVNMVLKPIIIQQAVNEDTV
jgi:hypothetical protein